MSRICHIIKINSRTVEAMGEGLNKLKERYGDSFSRLFRSITSDNGSEFARMTELPETAILLYAPIQRLGTQYEREAEFSHPSLLSQGNKL